MKIFIIPTSYPDSQYPQKDIFIYEQAKELARRGHSITILHVKKLPSKYYFSSVDKRILQFDDGFALRFMIKQKTFMESQLPGVNRDDFIDSVKRLYSHALSVVGAPDVIYAHFSCWAGFAASLISKEYGIPLVSIEHYGHYLKSKINNQLKLAANTTRMQSDAFLCVSLNLKKCIEKLSNIDKEIIVLPNMVDRQFKYVPVIQKEEFVFSSIGNLSRGKDFYRLIKAFSIAFSANEKVILRIGGGGPEKKKLEKLIKKLNRSNQIVLLGRLTREQTIEEYINCNAFALASQFETYGMVYREALVTGRPIVTTNHGGFSSDDWHDEYGIMIPKKNTGKLADALKKIVQDYAEYHGDTISKICLNDCSADVVGNKLEEILISVVKKT